MPYPVYTPRVNNNDDIVQIIHLGVQEGDQIDAGDLVAEVETDKAVVEVAAEQKGYVLKVLCGEEDKVNVGSVMMWIGETLDDVIPDSTAPAINESQSTALGKKPTAKAHVLLRKYNLRVEEVPHAGDRLTAGDIEAFVTAKTRAGNLEKRPSETHSITTEPVPEVPGSLNALSLEEHGMASTVAWHRDHAAATYLELEYDVKPWKTYAANFADRYKFMLSPLLPLMAYRLVEIARGMPKINCTLVNGQKYNYDEVNLGFTVQVQETLFLTVIRKADAMNSKQFVDALGDLQRQAMAKKLRPENLQGATLSFSSMARWNVTRHVPILAPYTALMIAHAAPGKDGETAVLGATYDHRVLSGFDVARVLRELITPPESL